MLIQSTRLSKLEADLIRNRIALYWLKKTESDSFTRFIDTASKTGGVRVHVAMALMSNELAPSQQS